MLEVEPRWTGVAGEMKPSHPVHLVTVSRVAHVCGNHRTAISGPFWAESISMAPQSVSEGRRCYGEGEDKLICPEKRRCPTAKRPPSTGFRPLTQI